MKRNNIFIFAVALLLSSSLLLFRCTDALKNVEVTVNSDIFKYTTLIDVASSSGEMLDDASVTLSGPDAAKIYNMDGYQSFKIAGGILSLAVDPNQSPMDDAPVEFNVTIQKSGYLPVNIPVVITKSDSSSLRYVVMVNNANPPAGVDSKSNAISLDDAKIAKDTTINVVSGNVSSSDVGIDFKAGTQFKDAQGKVLVDVSDIKITTLTVDASNNEALSVFPGGGLNQNSVQTENGPAAGTLFPAGLTEISMSSNGQEIKGFTTPIQIKLQVNPDYINPLTNTKIKAGDVLKVYSYSIDKGFWQYENTGTVVNANGHLAININATHLTWYMTGVFNTACGTNLAFKINAAWLNSGVTSPVTFKVFSTTNGGASIDKLIATTSITAHDGDTLSLKNTPDIPVIVKAYDIVGNEIYSSSISNPCGIGMQNATLVNSGATNHPKTTMQLYVRCPNRDKPINVLPTFYLYFKVAGAPDKDYALVGKVINGYISTTLLDVNKRYDFKAIWGNSVKVVNDKTVQADNSATVGDNNSAGELIGSKVGATNLEILKEKCSSL